MTKFVKFAALAATMLVTTPALAAPVGVTGTPPTATARIIKPLTLTPTGAATIPLTSSGSPGDDFAIGGSITIAAATVDGLYTGTVNVTVDY